MCHCVLYMYCLTCSFLIQVIHFLYSLSSVLLGTIKGFAHTKITEYSINCIKNKFFEFRMYNLIKICIIYILGNQCTLYQYFVNVKQLHLTQNVKLNKITVSEIWGYLGTLPLFKYYSLQRFILNNLIQGFSGKEDTI